MNYLNDRALFDLKNTTPDPQIYNKELTPPQSVSLNNGNSVLVTKYIEISNRSSEASNSLLLDGVFVTKNRNPLPLSILNTTNFYCSRYSSAISKGIVFQNNNLSLNSNLFINFWIYPIYSVQILKPISILTKGDSKSFGEYTVQITVDKKLQFGFSANGINTVLKTNNIIHEKKLTFVSIVKTISKISIFLNNIADNQMTFQVNPLQSSNPLLIGIGYNTTDLNGYIDNLTISDNVNDTLNMIYLFYTYQPIDYYFTFQKGLITFNGYNYTKNINSVTPNGIYDAKFFCELLDNYCNGICNSSNKYLYYSSFEDNSVNVNNSIIYEKASIFTIANHDFVSIKMDIDNQKNISLSQKYLLNGYYKSFTEEIYYFVNGELYQYNQYNNMYSLVSLDMNTAVNLMNIINDICVLELINNKFIYYSSYVLDDSNQAINDIFRKKSQYNFGQNNSIINFIGEVKLGSFNSINTETINPFKNLDNIVDNNTVESNTIKNSPISKEFADIITNNISNVMTSYLYAYDTNNINISGLLNTSGDFFINKLPKLTNKLQVDFKLNDETDLIDLLLRNQISIGKQVIINYFKPLDIGIYNFSIITSSIIKIKMANKEYSINSMIPQHILFHNTSEICNIELTFFYQKINQICKFIVID
jgi:hypothetical protein